MGRLSEEIRILAPIGTERHVWDAALSVGLRFASEYMDRRPGLAGAVVYGGGGRVSFVAYWTPRRRVVVYVQEEVSRG